MTDKDIKDEMRESIRSELEDGDYPLENQMDALNALSNGMQTKFKSGDLEISVMEFASKVDLDFPFESVDELADDAIEQLEDLGFFDEEESEEE